MILFIELVVICVILVLSFKVITEEKMLFEKYGEIFEKKVEGGDKKYSLLYCVWCMPSLFCAFAFFFSYLLGLFQLSNWRIFILYPLVVGASSFICGMFWGAYQLMDAKTRYYINAEKLKYFEIKDRKTKYHEKSSQRQ